MMRDGTEKWLNYSFPNSIITGTASLPLQRHGALPPQTCHAITVDEHMTESSAGQYHITPKYTIPTNDKKW
jgi:hypothetical protein